MSPSVYPAAFVLFFSALYVAAYVQRKRLKLDKIPTIGYSGIITSWLGAFATMINAHCLIQEGYGEHRIFKIARPSTWLVLVNGSEYMEEVRKAEEDQLSFLAVVHEAGQFDYTIGPGLRSDPYHVNIVRGPMTRSIGDRVPDLVDEVDKAFVDVLGGVKEDWVSLPTYTSVVHIISRVSARFFVGPKLSSNPRYTDIMQGFTLHVAIVGLIIRHLPTFLKPFVSHTLFNSPAKVREVEDFLRPVIEERLKKKDSKQNPEPDDMLTWLLNPTPGNQRTITEVALRMIFVNVAAIHTTAALLTHVLYNLATYPSYIEPLREEISTILRQGGWSKVALDRMQKLDSFVKETQRLHGCDAIILARKVVSDFTFSDGTFVPKGTDIAATNRPINHDERLYPDPQEFQGFRFVDQDPAKRPLTALTSEFMTFGLGRHACPGRFFVAAEVKIIVARLLLEYDITLADERSGRPKDFWFTGLFMVPNRQASVSFRKRKT